VWSAVRRRPQSAGINADITPHSLRYTFIALALDGGAPLHEVQHAAGHADPRTTDGYDQGMDNLDDYAADYMKLQLGTWCPDSDAAHGQ